MKSRSRDEMLRLHLRRLTACRRCPAMHPPVVVGRPVLSRVVLLGQAPGIKEPLLGRPFAWTAGRTLFRWFESALGWNEEETRNRLYFAAVCRCFPGKASRGGDRVPNDAEIANCSVWLRRELDLLAPDLVLPVGRLAISQFLSFEALADVVGRAWPAQIGEWRGEVIPLPHPSGASTWHRTEPGRTLLSRALRLLARHPALGNGRRTARPAQAPRARRLP